MSKTSCLNRRQLLVGVAASMALPAIARASNARSRDTQFELVGDGVADNGPALRRMLSEAEARGRGVVTLPAGRFVVAPEGKRAALTLPANVRLHGAGRTETTIVMAEGAFGHVINAPYGWVEIADLAVDGNEGRRPGATGHNIRVNGDRIRVERVSSRNAVSYGLAIGQKRFARDVLVRDVEIVNSGADGIDVKNSLGRTESIVFEDVTVQGFGRRKAGMDLRGQCEVRGLNVLGVLADSVGLRFRPGERDWGNGPGAHGSSARNIVVRGTAGQPMSIGIAVVARDVLLENVDVSDAAVGLLFSAANGAVSRGKVARSTRAAIHGRATRTTRPDRIVLDTITFIEEADFVFTEVEEVVFDRCSFTECRGTIQEELQKDPRIVLSDCDFDRSCR